MADPFTQASFAPFYKRAKDLERKFKESPRSVKVGVLEGLRKSLTGYARQHSEDLFRLVVKRHAPADLRDEALDDDYLVSIKERSVREWLQVLNRAFSVAIDSIENLDTNKSIFSRLFKMVKRMIGFGDTGWYAVGDPAKFDPRLAKSKDITLRDTLVYNSYTTASRVARGGNQHVYVVTPPAKPEKVTPTKHKAEIVKVISKHPSEPRAAQVLGFTRLRRGRVSAIKLSSYLKMLYKTVPKRLERDLIDVILSRYEADERRLVVGGKVKNSAHTCIWCDGKVLTSAAVQFVAETPMLKDHLFHPNCRHSLRAVPKGYKGKVWTVDAIRSKISNGRIR
jgi:hypothetical protein